MWFYLQKVDSLIKEPEQTLATTKGLSPAGASESGRKNMNQSPHCQMEAMHEVLLGHGGEYYMRSCRGALQKEKLRQGLGSELGGSAGCNRACLQPVHARWRPVLIAMCMFRACRGNKDSRLPHSGSKPPLCACLLLRAHASESGRGGVGEP